MQSIETKIGDDLSLAKALLESGELVAIPTETVYGLAANALDPDAVLKIFKAKNRPHFNPLIIHLPTWDAVKKYVAEIPPAAARLAAQFSPGAITFLLPKNERISDLVTAGSAKVAVRIPAHPVAQALLRQLDFPLAAPSANPFGYVSPTTAQHVLEGLGGKIQYVLDGGACAVGLESTIVDFENEEVIIRRKGGVAVEEIEKCLGKPAILKTSAEEHPVAPGQLKNHYATATPLLIGKLESRLIEFQGKKICLLEFGENDNREVILRSFPVFQRTNLSPSGNLEEAAKRLFAAMRQADQSGADLILTEWLPEEGLGSAINDRLRRAEFHVSDTSKVSDT